MRKWVAHSFTTDQHYLPFGLFISLIAYDFSSSVPLSAPSPVILFCMWLISPRWVRISVIIYCFVSLLFTFFLSLYPLRFRHENKGISVPSPIGSYRQTPSGVAGDTPPNVTISLEARPGRTCAAGSMTTVNWIFRVWPPSGTCSITVLTR